MHDIRQYYVENPLKIPKKLTERLKLVENLLIDQMKVQETLKPLKSRRDALTFALALSTEERNELVTLNKSIRYISAILLQSTEWKLIQKYLMKVNPKQKSLLQKYHTWTQLKKEIFNQQRYYDYLLGGLTEDLAMQWIYEHMSITKKSFRRDRLRWEKYAKTHDLSVKQYLKCCEYRWSLICKIISLF